MPTENARGILYRTKGRNAVQEAARVRRTARLDPLVSEMWDPAGDAAPIIFVFLSELPFQRGFFIGKNKNMDNDEEQGEVGCNV